jgi:asparagine synthase (glutamine-hydrolysing)
MPVIWGCSTRADEEGVWEALSGAMRAQGAFADFRVVQGAGWRMGVAEPMDPHAPVRDMVGTAGQACVACDAFLTNRPELMREMGMDGDPSSPVVAQRAVERWGIDAVQRLQGAWSMAAAGGSGLALMSDPLGLRPLFYVQQPGWTAFASDPDALRVLPGVANGIDPFGIAASFVEELAWVDPGMTAIRGVRAVPAGCVVEFPPGGTPSIRRYRPVQAPPLVQIRTAEEVSARFREVFGRAVHACLDESRAPALLLSGGIDSGAVLAAARGFHADAQAPLCAISGITDAGEFGLDEEMRNLHALLAGHRSRTGFVVPPAARGPDPGSADIAEVAWAPPHPLHGSVLVHGIGFRLARQQGCDVVLDGIDGDLVMAPYADPLVTALRRGRMLSAWRDVRAASRVHTHLRRHGMASIAARSLVHALVPRWLARWRRVARVSGDLLRVPLAHDLVLSRDLLERVRTARAALPSDDRERHAQLLFHRLSRSIGGTRMVANRWGVDSRHPWADLRVIEFFASLPLEWRVRGGWTKYPARLACERALGPEVVWHSGKSHVGMVLTAEVVNDAAPYLAGVVEAQRDALVVILDAGLVDQALAYLRAPDAGGNADNAMFVASMAGWLAGVSQANATHQVPCASG